MKKCYELKKLNVVIPPDEETVGPPSLAKTSATPMPKEGPSNPPK